MSFAFPPNRALSDASFTESEPILTAKQFKQRYLFGIELTDYNGNKIPDEVFDHYLAASVSYLEHKLDIIIKKRDFVERYDYRGIDYLNFNFIQLKKRPISDVEEIKAKFPHNRELVAYPKEWYVVEKEAAQVQLSPVEGTFSGLIVTQGGSYMPLIFGTRDHWPHLFEIKYTAGFCDDQIPVIINEMIGMQAAIRLFEIVGDIILGPTPVSGESVSLDGAAVSKQNTAAAGKSLYGARIDGYKDALKDYISTVKKYYNGIPFAIA